MRIQAIQNKSVTSQSGINPPVRLPMINIIALNEKKKKEK